MANIFNSALHQNAGNIIISGGGLAGLSTSLGLSKLGYRVDVIECRKEWLQQGSAFGLAASGRKALKELFASSEPLERLVENGIYSEEYDTYLLLWYMVRDALLEEAMRWSSRITIHMGKRIVSYDDTSDPLEIEVVVEDVGCENKKAKLKGSLLIAADGVYSNLRKLAGLEPAKFATKTQWRGTIPHVPKGSILEPLLDKGMTPLLLHDSTKGICSGEGMLLLFNFHPKIERKMTLTMTACVSNLLPGTHPRELFCKLKPGLYHQQILEEVYKLADDSELCYPLPMAVIELPDDGRKGWGGKGRVLFVGDCAHAMRPASGLGGAMAFEDAAILCRLLNNNGFDSLRTKDSAEAFVRSFESSRFERVKIIWDDQWEIAEGAYKKQSDYNLKWTPSFAAWVKEGV